MNEPSSEDVVKGAEILHKYDCPGCGVSPGYRHSENCDVARCNLHGTQYFSCDFCVEYDQYDNEIVLFPDAQPTIWTGEWPGVAECREFNMYVYDFPGIPGKSEDLNRLYMMGMTGKLTWDVEKERWVKN